MDKPNWNDKILQDYEQEANVNPVFINIPSSSLKATDTFEYTETPNHSTLKDLESRNKYSY